MTKLYSLFGGTTTDTEVKSVEVNQIVQMVGYSYSRYVVHKITHNQFGYHYHLINLRTFDFHQSEIIKPLSQKFGIGMYYDDKNIEFMLEEEVAELYAKAQAKRVDEMEQERAEEKRREEVRVIGREWLRNNLPVDAKAIIVGRLKQDESDSQTDYFASSTVSNVILGFSKHTRDIFSEMRKHASNFEGTAYLAEYNEDYEHREKYSMGAGYYLGESKYRGWIIEKEPIYNRERTIEEFAYTAGSSDGIHIKPNKTNKGNTVDNADNINPSESEQQSDNLQFEIIDYSEKAIALFGDTKPIKDLLSAMGGKFNPRLTYKDTKKAGWIFSKTKRKELEGVLSLNK
ncbi:MAG: fusion protein [Dysgonomonas mossii]|uniref:fusion protein n=1 Tax=Dysgonomonas mossii TaxID=163665 RepID=UPI0039947ACA